jgi:hypothetical protein
MLNKKFRAGAVTLLVLSVSSCNNNIPNNTNTKPEYGFETKELSASYLKRKLNFWLDAEPVKGAQLVKEIAYARFKDPDLFCSIMEDDDLLFEEINTEPAVEQRKLADNGFKLFLEGCVEKEIPFIGEFQVNTYTTSNQLHPSVAMDDTGNFVVTWDSNQDGSGGGVYAQRYSSTGSPLGSEFQVNTFTTNHQKEPSIAMDNNGDFVITWISDGQDGNYNGIFGQRYGSTGSPLGSEFQVNTYTTDNQTLPSVAMDNDGDFVITWTNAGLGLGTQDGSYEGIFAQRYSSTGAPLGSEFRVNTFTTFTQTEPSVAVDNDGDFVITWTSLGQDGSQYGVYAQRYTSTGSANGTEFQVNTFTTHIQGYSSIAMDDNGDFVITWVSGYFSGTGQDGSLYGIYAQRYGSTGSPLGSEFQVNTFTDLAQRKSAIAMDADGDFAITWTSNGQDGIGDGVFGQRYSSTGAPSGSEFLVNTFANLAPKNPAVAMDADGDFAISWQSGAYNNSGQDGSYNGIFAQRYNASGESR